LHAACRSKGALITICAAMILATLLFDGATTAHSLFSYPVEDESNDDYQNVAFVNTIKNVLNFYMRSL
jgi:hypothetical protein